MLLFSSLAHSLSPSLSGVFVWIDMIYSALQWEHNDVLSNELISI